MRHLLQEREISTVYMLCLVVSQPGHFATNHKSTHMKALLAVDHGEDGSLSVCVKSQVRGAISQSTIRQKLKHTVGRNGKGSQHPDQTTTQPTPNSIHSLEMTPSPREMNTTPKDPRGLHLPQNEKPTRTPPPKKQN